MSTCLNLISKVTVGAFLGTIAGLVVGTGAGGLFAATHPYDKALGSQDVQAMAKGFTVIGLIIIGGCIGFVAGTIAAIVLHVRQSRRTSQSH